MTQVGQMIMTGLLSPAQACQDIDMIQPRTLVVEPGEPGWRFWNFSFQIVRNHIYVVVNYAHNDDLDRGVAVSKMRVSMRNMVNWLLLGQSLVSSVTIELASDEIMVRYEGDEAWVAHIPPEEEEPEPLQTGSNEAIQVGVNWLPFLLKDRRLLYAIQDYSASLNYPEFCLFFVWRAVEWILWEFETRQDLKTPRYAPAAKALGLTDRWIQEIARLAHSYTRHARLRDAPDPRLVEAAQERVRTLILRYIDVKHRHAEPTELQTDLLTDWTAPKAA